MNFNDVTQYSNLIDAGTQINDKIKGVKTIVYCKDCKYYSTNNPLISNVCSRLFTVFPMQAYDFCSYGERK